jgi:diguanylate cyclase (GGDEF)-like protein/PAS domain S-box-containing protein
MVIWETDAEGRCTYLNPAALGGLSSPEQIRIDDWMQFIHSDDIDYTQAVLHNARVHGLEYQLEYRVVRSDGSTRWMMSSGSPRRNAAGDVAGFVGTIVDVSEQHTSRLKQLSTHDALTGLPTRQIIRERLGQRLLDPRGELPQAVLLIDIDQFKAINEGLGREAGDQVLQEVSKRLLDAVRGNDLVSRLSGDEFVVIAECRNGATSAGRVATKVVEALARPLLVSGRDVGVSASIGISLYPQDGITCDALFQNADTALYSAKLNRDGGSAFRFYTAEMSSQSKSRMLLLSALRMALEKDQFTVYYQPRVDLRTMEVVGMEALLRWNHPELGSVSPAQFIPLAEEAGLIEPIGAWVLKEATRQAQIWSKLHDRPFRMSVNVSARQLRTSRLVETVNEALAESGLPANQLELELTETALMVDTTLAGKLLTEVRALGVHLSVDDFGTGYSSLSYLSLFPLDCLKLDKSFLEHRPNAVNPQKLAKAIINLAHSLNLTVVAEGVETREHLGFLRGAACDEIQGFCISVPLPPDEFTKFIQDTHTSFKFDDEKVLKGRATA